MFGSTASESGDIDNPGLESQVSIDVIHNSLSSEIEALVSSKQGGLSGFFVTPNGIDALSARIVMARRAEETLDVQYYLIHNDIIGRLFIRELIRAADRGVRVRLLLDDIFTVGIDKALALVDSHPNIEIRLFNPFSRGMFGRAASALADFGRINRRMHNKSFTADNAVTIIGGRNIADEYFSASEKTHFGDFDVVAIGNIVQEVSGMFDEYWSHEAAIPVGAMVSLTGDMEADFELLRGRLEQSYGSILKSDYADAVRVRVDEFLGENAGRYVWAPHRFVADRPDKALKTKADDVSSILSPILDSINSAERKLIVVSPYFVPTDAGVATLKELRSRGVDVSVVTNSLAANNQIAVHGAYARSRKALLQAGIALFEMRRDATMMGSEYTRSGETKTTLHTKGFIVDDREFFIGSFNFDPRSAHINTELGVIVSDRDLTRFYQKIVDEQLPTHTYTVFLDKDGNVRWRGVTDGQPVILDKEPDTSWGQRFLAKLIGFLPLESQL